MPGTIYGDIKPIEPTYVVETDNSICHIPATRCSIDTELKIICFYAKDSVNAMFRVEDVKNFWRVI